jgi:hypothetical protein
MEDPVWPAAIPGNTKIPLPSIPAILIAIIVVRVNFLSNFFNIFVFKQNNNFFWIFKPIFKLILKRNLIIIKLNLLSFIFAKIIIRIYEKVSPFGCTRKYGREDGRICRISYASSIF